MPIPPDALRLITPSDNFGIQAVIQTVMTSFGCVGEGYSINDAEVRDMHAHYQAPRHRYFVVMENDHVVGGAGIAPLAGSDVTTCELRKMYLLPECRGKGYGEALMKACLDFAREAGFTNCYLETLASMRAARSLYEKWGFKTLPAPLGVTGHHGCDVWMALKLKST